MTRMTDEELNNWLNVRDPPFPFSTSELVTELLSARAKIRVAVCALSNIVKEDADDFDIIAHEALSILRGEGEVEK